MTAKEWILVLSISTVGQVARAQSNQIVADLIQVHERLYVEVFSNVCVDSRAATLLDGTSKAGPIFHYCRAGRSVLERNGEHIAAANEDYAFAATEDVGIQYLSGNRKPPDNLKSFAEDKANHLILSTAFNRRPITEVLSDKNFQLALAEETESVVVIDGSFSDAGLIFKDLHFEFDKANHMQLLKASCSISVSKATQKLEPARLKFEYAYYSQPLGGTNVRLLKTITSEASESRDGKISTERKITEFFNWSRNSVEDSEFLLSRYGFEEPDINALNGGIRWSQVFGALTVGAIGIGVLFWKFAKRK